MTLTRRAIAELIGTFWLVLGGCGAALLAARFNPGGIGLLGVALAFGLSVLTGAYALGSISGAHFNPAITVGLASARRFPAKDVIPYILAQVVGALLGSVILYMIARGAPGFDAQTSGFAANGYGAHSPGGYALGAALVSEIVMTFMFVMIVLGVTDGRWPALKVFAPLAIGLALTLIHLVSLPVTNTSVNPARSTGPAIFAGGWALAQLWVFWVAPMIGAVVAGILYPAMTGETETAVTPAEEGARPVATTITTEAGAPVHGH